MTNRKRSISRAKSGDCIEPRMGFGLVAALFLVSLVLLAGVAGFVVHEKAKNSAPPLKACPADAMLCSDGSYVGRTGPNCEFVCPQASSSSNAVGTQSSGSSADASGWTTYRNEKYGFEFMYDPEWDPIEKNDKNFIFDLYINNPAIQDGPIGDLWDTYTLYVLQDTEGGLNNWFKNNAQLSQKNEQTRAVKLGYDDAQVGVDTSTTNIDGQPAIVQIFNCTTRGSEICYEDNARKDYYFEKNGIIFDFSKNSNLTSDSNVFDKVVSTFKFIEPSSTVDTSNWKTYRNEEYGFEVKYPSDWIVSNENDGYAGGPDIYFSSRKRKIATDQNKVNCSAGGTSSSCIPEWVPWDLAFSASSSLEYAAPETIRHEVINGIEFEAYETQGLFNSLEYETQEGGKTFNFELMQAEFATEKQILSTFKFIEPTSTSSSADAVGSPCGSGMFTCVRDGGGVCKLDEANLGRGHCVADPINSDSEQNISGNISDIFQKNGDYFINISVTHHVDQGPDACCWLPTGETRTIQVDKNVEVLFDTATGAPMLSFSKFMELESMSSSSASDAYYSYGIPPPFDGFRFYLTSGGLVNKLESFYYP